MQHAAATLGSGNLKLAVQLPEGEDMNEWVAVNSEWCGVFLDCMCEFSLCVWCLLLLLAVDFFNQINMLYGTITEQCTTESCPVMSAGPK